MKSLFLVFLFSTTVLGKDSVGTVAMIKGDVQRVIEKGRRSEKLMPNSSIYALDSIKVGKRSVVKILFRDDSLVTIGPQSDFEVTKFDFKKPTDRKIEFSLLSGKLRALFFNPAKGEDDLKIQVKTVALGVRGTEFLIDAGKKVSGLVLSGRVEVNKEKMILAGEHFALSLDSKSFNQATFDSGQLREFINNPDLLLPAPKNLKRIKGKVRFREKQLKSVKVSPLINPGPGPGDQGSDIQMSNPKVKEMLRLQESYRTRSRDGNTNERKKRLPKKSLIKKPKPKLPPIQPNAP